MKVKVDRGLLPVKAHFFFFFAALGPLLPQMNVFGRQLGASPAAMGAVTAALPLLWAVAKPSFGYLVDYFTNQRKLIFMLLITTMTSSYCLLWILPVSKNVIDTQINEKVYKLNHTVYLESIDSTYADGTLNKYQCRWDCASSNFEISFSNSTFINTLYVDRVDTDTCSVLNMDFDEVRDGSVVCLPKKGCNLLCKEVFKLNLTMDNATKRLRREVNNTERNLNSITEEVKPPKLPAEAKRSEVERSADGEANFYYSFTFWWFVVMMCIGTVAFNVSNCISDAICFDVLGPERGSSYGSQRAWGTVGYGVTALLGGWLIDLVSNGTNKDFTPAFALAAVFTFFDLLSCRALKLPSLTSPADSGKALRDVLRIPRVVIFIIFAVVAGTLDSFIIYYMFWFLEELAETTGYSAKIKLIEGIVVAAQSFVGELVFFSFSGKIISRYGYGATMSFSLCCYGVRMALISLITSPWQLVFIEGIMQGPTYALCYSCIVGYAAAVAPEGYSATVQGIVAGMDDGVGFAIGSLLGGLLYSCVGGRTSFRVFALSAICAGLGHGAILAVMSRPDPKPRNQPAVPEGEKMLPSQELNSFVYKDTVIPLTIDSKASINSS